MLSALLAVTILTTLPAAAEETPIETAPLSPAWAPLTPAAILAPGVGHLLRGERRAGGTLLALAGASFTVSLASAAFLALSGASDVSGIISIPLLLLNLSSLFTLAATDLVGAFSGNDSPHLTDTFDATTRVVLSVLTPMKSSPEPAPELRASYRADRWKIEAAAGTTVNSAQGPALELQAGVRLLGYTSEQPKAGLWLEASARHEWAAGYRTLRTRAQLVSALPMGLFAPRLQRLTALLRAGVDPTWLWYGGKGSTDFELPVSGGFELRLVLTENLRALAGYEHARDGAVGGLALGFVGSFYGGLELLLAQQVVLFARAHAGTPNGFSAGLEWRR